MEQKDDKDEKEEVQPEKSTLSGDVQLQQLIINSKPMFE